MKIKKFHPQPRPRAAVRGFLTKFFPVFLVVLLLPACTPKQTVREQFQSIQDYMVYYGEGRAEELARFDLAIIQPETLDTAGLRLLHDRGTLVIAYLSVGELEPSRPWSNNGRVDPAWLLGENPDWGSYYVDARQTGWQQLMASLTGEYLRQGFDGVFLDTVDTVEAYPETTDGMVTLIHNLRSANPQALIVQNRGFSILEAVSGNLDAVMFEDLSSTYDPGRRSYASVPEISTADLLAAFHVRTGLPILSLDYAPLDNPGMAARAVKVARSYGFIPAVSVGNLDDIPDYGLERGGPADLRVTSISAEGNRGMVTLIARIQNTGLDTAVDVPLTFTVDGQQAAALTNTFEPGDIFDWRIDWPVPQDNMLVEVSVAYPDATLADNSLTWTFTSASVAIEPVLPFDQQKHRPEGNGPSLSAVFLASPPKIDGDLSEWADSPCIELNTQEQISYGNPAGWSGPSDLSGRACYGWDNENLYVAFSVEDDAIVQKYTAGDLWMGDHIELWFDTQLQLDFASATNGDDDYQLGVSPGDFASVKQDFVIFTPTVDPAGYKSLVEYVVLRTSTGYAGEAKIPAAVLKGLRLAPGQVIGATFEISDTDTPGGSEQELMLSSAPQSSSNWGNPTLWNNLIFENDRGGHHGEPHD